MRCGCSINDVNLIRQHVDAVKGGGLLEWAAPASVTTLILSDVIGNNMAHIGSGPTVPIAYDLERVNAVLAQFDVSRYLSAETETILTAHLNTLQNNSPQSNQQTYSNIIIGDVKHSAEAAATVANAHSYTTTIVSTELIGEAREVGERLAAELIAMMPGSCHIYGGETTVTLSAENNGSGGRNQELALAAAIALDGHRNCWLATLATDGEDGPNAGAGAIVNGQTVQLASEKLLSAPNFLDHHDSFTFFEQLGKGHLRIGSTGTNVNDLTILLKPVN